MPVSHAGVAPAKPIITVIGSNEFLIVSNLDDRGLAVFISGSGDPVRGTFEYSKYPVSVCKSSCERIFFVSRSSSLQRTMTPTWWPSCRTRVSRYVTLRRSPLNRLSPLLNRLLSIQTSQDKVSLGIHRVTWSLPLSSRMPCNLYPYH